ncbi:DinB family protein [Pendulispora albinea]|uniref:DinB family protein n=1 Tax=Pendulispora albinea TaxID=2741071 RepID=A0ABZ2M557_9BACT
MSMIRPSDLEPILAGDARARRAFVLELSPLVRAHVTRALLRRRARARRHDVRQEVADMVQEVFAALFEDDAKSLRAWSPERGLSFSSFVGLLCERQVHAILRSGRRSPWRNEATEPAQLDAHMQPGPNLDRRIEQEDMARAVVLRTAGELSPRGQEFLRVLFLEGKAVDDATAQLQVSADVVYAWRTRIIKRARRIGAGLETNFVRAVRFREVAHKKGRAGKETAMIGLSPELEAQLRTLPALLREMAYSITSAQSRLSGPGPAPSDGFSLLEHAWHLADLEREAFAVRIARVLAEDTPELPDFDGDHEAKVRRYRERDLGTAIATFATVRTANLERLAKVAPDAWARTAIQAGVGPITLADLVCRMLDHDRAHAAELLELLVAIGASHARIPALEEMAHAAKPTPCAA